MHSKKFLLAELCGTWLREQKHRIAPSTYVKYEQLIRRYILSFFSEKSCNDLKEQDLEAFSQYIRQEFASENLSAGNQRTSIMLLNRILEYGNQHHFISFKTHIMPNIKRKKAFVRVFSQAELYKLESYIDAHPHNYTLAILIALYSGVRIGELCAIRWNDIDFNNGTLMIARSVQRINTQDGTSKKKTELRISLPKSNAGIRLIPLPSFIIEYIRPFFSTENLDHYLLTNCEMPMEPRTLQYAYRRILQICQIPYLNFHCLRHTFATRCVTLGWDMKTLGEILGHSEIQITMEYYFHSSFEYKREQMNKLQRIS